MSWADAGSAIVVLAVNDTVELQGKLTGEDKCFAADHTRLWGFNVA